jgi:uncharacterized protein (TIGR02421 family)
MQKLSEQQILQNIKDGDCFECEITDGSFALKIDSYVPTVCVAPHAGHRMRGKLISNCLLSEEERLYEEDPYTDQFVQAMPITLIARDSRYEYDLNRPIANCIYKRAWGKTVWDKKLSLKERQVSVGKHQAFYRVLNTLIEELEQRFGATLILDIHSYNFQRREEAMPTFNIGTEQIDEDRWRGVIDYALRRLARIELPNLPVDAAENRAFFGRGYLVAHINSHFQNSLVLPVEIKKVFMNEASGEPYPLVMQALSQQFKLFLIEISAHFAKRYTRKRRTRKIDMLAENLEPSILRLDRSLYRLARGLETLYYINPINIETERRQFFKQKGQYLPHFHYRQLDIDPYRFREQLYRLPVEDIRDPNIQSLYRDVINSLSEKIAMLVTTGTSQFLYESLKYYGEPSITDEQNARFLLHAAKFAESDTEFYDTPQLLKAFKERASELGMQCKIETSSKLVASAMVSTARKTVLVAKGLTLSRMEAEALIHHELGVHMATTLNAAQQRLKVFSLGLPGNTHTQEGLAILNEYQSGNLTLQRLRGLALRVLAVRQMLRDGNFRHTFSYLHEEFDMPENDAFKLALRVHRGGGFTKDYLYLSGVSKALALAENCDIRGLYVGKTGFAYLPVIDEMIGRQLIDAPVFYPAFLKSPAPVSPELQYLMRCIRADNTRPIAA